MPPWVVWLLLAAAFVAILWAARRAVTVFEIRAEGGEVVSARGRIPQELLDDVADVCKRGRVTCVIAGRLEGGKVAVKLSGAIDEASAQRIRNVVGRFPTHRIKTARRT